MHLSLSNNKSCPCRMRLTILNSLSSPQSPLSHYTSVCVSRTCDGHSERRQAGPSLRCTPWCIMLSRRLWTCWRPHWPDKQQLWQASDEAVRGSDGWHEQPPVTLSQWHHASSCGGGDGHVQKRLYTRMHTNDRSDRSKCEARHNIFTFKWTREVLNKTDAKHKSCLPACCVFEAGRKHGMLVCWFLRQLVKRRYVSI